MNTPDRYDRENASQAFAAIARQTITNGGGTFRRETGAPVTLTTGYTVGVGVAAQTTLATLALGHIAGLLAKEWPTTAPANAQYVGTWIDGTTLYVDHVTVISDLGIALSLAARHNELAIWDNANGCSIIL